MPRAAFLIPEVGDEYPWKAVRTGLTHLGYSIGRDLDADILVTWSPWKRSYRHEVERHFIDAGRPVIVVENGWLSPVHGAAHFQVSLGGWNGTGRFSVGPARRWRDWRLPMSPWKTTGLYDLIIGQRGHPSDPRTAPPGWHETLQLEGRVVRRPRQATTNIVHDLRNARACHVWTSNAAAWAMLCGVPVVQHGPNLMLSELASRPGEELRRPDREPVLERAAWAQFTETEIETGEPMARLLEMAA